MVVFSNMAVDGTSGLSRETEDLLVEIWPYSRENGVGSWADEGSSLDVGVTGEHEMPVATIAGNRAGLRSLARYLLTLADERTPVGRHFDFDRDRGTLSEDTRAELRLELHA